jgi:Flp pilus assembly protein TadD
MSSREQQITTHHRAAQKAIREGHLGEAHQHCLAILTLDQHFADAWFLCGVIAAHNGQSAKAIDIFHTAIKLAPHNVEYFAELGKQLVASHQPQQALLKARQALALAPTSLPTLNTLGTVFSHCGEHEDALACYERAVHALQSRPPQASNLPTAWQADLYFNTAASLQFAGRFDDAERNYEKAITLQPHLYKAHYALSLLRTQTDDDNHLDRLLSLRNTVAAPQDQLRVGHAIAKEQEDLGQFSESLASLAWAKRAQASHIAYDSQDDAALFDCIKQQFNAAPFSRQQTGYDNPEPIFIVGMPRTGTTLVEQILSGHSRVRAAGELPNFPLQVKRMTGSPSADVLDVETLRRSVQLDMPALGSGYLQSTRPRTGHTPYFIDKLPLNFLYLGLIKLALPNAKLVCLRRDPMDTCLSNYRQLFAANFRHYHYSIDLLDCGRYYIEFDRLMRHWHEVMPGAVFELRYEALVENPEQVSRELLAHCGLSWEDQCLAFHRRKTSVATASAVQVRKAIYSSSVNRWQRYGGAVQPLFELLQSAGFYH